MQLKPLHIIGILVLIVAAGIGIASFLNRPGPTDFTGQLAPEIEGTDLEGRIIKLSQFQGKTVILSFWASWCKPCREEAPDLKELYQKYQQVDFPDSEGLVVLMFSLDKEKAPWYNAIEKDSLDWAVHITDLNAWDSPVKTDYNLISIPNISLIDPNGVIVGQDLQLEELQNALDKQLSTASNK